MIIFFNTYILLVTISLFLIIVRIAGIYDTANLTKFIPIVMFFLYLFYILKIGKLKYRFDFIFKFFFFIMIYGFVLGLNNMNNFKYILSELMVSITALMTYLLFYNSKISLISLNGLLNKYSYVIFYVQSLVIIIGWTLKLTFFPSLYLSLVNQIMLFPFAWYLITANKRMLFLTFIVIIAGGKIGVLISAVVVLLSYSFLKNKKTFFSIFMRSSFFISIAIFILYLVRNLKMDVEGIISLIFWKIQTYNPFYVSSNINIEMLESFGGGRGLELVYSFKNLISDGYWKVFIGQGFGNEYYVPLYDMFLHNVHVTPFSLVTKFGVIIVLLIYAILFYNLLLFYKSTFLKNNNLVYKFFFCLFIGMGTYSLTAYSFFINLFLWICLSLLKKDLDYKRVNKTIKIEKDK